MKTDVIVKEYAKRLSSEDLAYLGIRFKQNMFGDRAEIAAKLSQDEEMDKWLSTSTTADELFDMMEMVGAQIKVEYTKRVEAAEEADYKYKKRRRDT